MDGYGYGYYIHIWFGYEPSSRFGFKLNDATSNNEFSRIRV
jgi:hypothetical protein